MITQPDVATVRETVEALRRRLARIAAAASTLGALDAEVSHDVPPADLLALLEQIRHDLSLAAHDADVAHARATLAIESIRDPHEER